MGHKLLIHPIFKSLSWHRRVGYKKIIQNRRFKYGVKIKNINNKPFGRAIIKKIKIFSGEDKRCQLVSDKEFEIKELNPEESYFIWFEKSTCPFSGLCWISFDLESKDSEEIFTFQWDLGNKASSNSHKENFWNNIFHTKDEFAMQQEITNVLLIILTFLIVVRGIF